MTEQTARKKTPATKRMTVERTFSTEGVHPYDATEWEFRDIVQKNWKTDEVIFEQRGVEFPKAWSVNASTIVATKYFRGALGTPERESSLRHLIDRVVDTYTKGAIDHGYMDEANAAVFSDELKWLLVNQHFSFNSPVWFNVGTTSPQQVSACFILSVDDNMDSILNWYREEGLIFKGGSGAGLNLSRIRSSKELLKSSGGTASGPVSFMRGADASAGTIKSGGATRRAAKMVVLDVDHPDVEEFIETKAREEDKIRVLRDAGYDMDLGGKDIVSVQYQNANNSVSVTDEFMRAVENGGEFGLKSRTSGEVIETVNARDLWHKIAVAAWECADPGLHYNDTMNDWHTNPATDKIRGSNPCSEFVFLDNTSCNLASLNLMKFVDADGTFDVVRFTKAVEHIITAMEISIAFGDFPTEDITRMSRDHRPLGIGYANIGALLMSKGLAYDSAAGRTLAAAITSLMTGASYRRSAEIAGVVGPYAAYEANERGHKRVMRKHRDDAKALADVAAGGHSKFPIEAQITDGIATVEAEAAEIAAAGHAEWVLGYKVGSENGWRNAQASVLAPTGTIGFMMDVDTTGVEPDFALTKFKKMVGGGSLTIINQQVPKALDVLGYTPEQAAEIEQFILDNGNVVDAPHLRVEHYPIFDCAVGNPRYIEPMGHVRMMAAVQPFLSGAISKTVNLPETATVEDIEAVYMDSWKLGLKATAVYRDNCKVGQPLSDAKSDTKDNHKVEGAAVEPVIVEKIVEKLVERPRRERLARRRRGVNTSFSVAGTDGYLTTGEHEDGRLGEVFLKMSKQGSTMAGMMDAFSVAISLGLQHGVPLETFVAKFINQRFEPAGFTDDEDVRMSSSIIDYVFRRLALDYLDYEARTAYGIYSTDERTEAVNGGGYGAVAQDEVVAEVPARVAVPESFETAPAHVDEDLIAERAKFQFGSGKTCEHCGSSRMVPTGACWNCEDCGNSEGCS